ncbi:hypothetical protein FisN_2Hh475 [Fistulifera solaris]|uniref:Uncharacterized protein n=1 Tax=Fistulifera solaris TaxID=1519565 RepID=A0A1Z5JG51_FISSO|nr:hypothetical protein FisN_2Hh475 [Fistulifera solaris]|eukprot:GAX12985.1 hypothetical protein FisN_2Hh475 [Fistulifera solaris]
MIFCWTKLVNRLQLKQSKLELAMWKLGVLFALSGTANVILTTRPSTALQLAANNQETLTFSVDYKLTSEPIPVDRKQEFLELFETNEICLSLLSSGGKRKVEEGTLSTVFKGYWDDICRKTPSLSQRNSDSRLFLTDTDSKFPGLTLFSTVCNGCTLVRDSAGRPKYEFLLLAEKQSVSGAAPVVWLFNKLTGRSKESENDFLKTSNEVKSSASVVDSGDSVALQFEVDAKIYVVFPKTLLNILPTSKEKMEEQGSASMRSAIVRDVDNAVAGAVNTFLQQKSLASDKL